MAFLDELTQLGNRHALKDHFKRFQAINIRNKSYGGVFCLDLDKFKSINDNYGHSAGDAVLIEVSKRLRHVIRTENIICRVGGDEFIILCSNISIDKKNALNKMRLIAKRIIISLETPIKHNQCSLNIGVSIGLKLITPEPQSIDLILQYVDIAMYKSKKSTTQKIYVFK